MSQLPTPLRSAPREGDTYWTVGISGPSVHQSRWFNDEYDLERLKNGMCFATREDAQQAREAVIAMFSQPES